MSILYIPGKIDVTSRYDLTSLQSGMYCDIVMVAVVGI